MCMVFLILSGKDQCNVLDCVLCHTSSTQVVAIRAVLVSAHIEANPPHPRTGPRRFSATKHGPITGPMDRKVVFCPANANDMTPCRPEIETQ
jgi:hypothetical protein